MEIIAIPERAFPSHELEDGTNHKFNVIKQIFFALPEVMAGTNLW